MNLGALVMYLVDVGSVIPGQIPGAKHFVIKGTSYTVGVVVVVNGNVSKLELVDSSQ